jgi:replicative DNA helicase
MSDWPTDPDAILALESDLLTYQGPDQIIDFHTMKAECDARQKTAVLLKSGLPSLNALIGGFQGGELIVLSGVTKHGKTTAARTFTRDFMAQGVASVWFSYELSAQEFLHSFPTLPEGYLPHELTGRSLTWLFHRCYEAKLKHGCRVVFIDHLHFLVDMAKLKHPSLEIGALVRQIKRLAMHLNMVVFLICHLTKTTFDQEPTEQELRDSSFIAQDADSTLMIWRKQNPMTKQFENEATLKICNHRRTGTMARKIPLVFRGGWLEEAIP